MKLTILTLGVTLALAGCAPMPHAGGGHGYGMHRGAAGAVSPEVYAQQMARMQDMHTKMAAARTPEERAALMSEHMAAMHDGMAMMGRMHGGMTGGGGGPMAMDPETMQRRMDMMEMMMRMMLDRQAGPPPPSQ